jgi:hypothetical protein
MVDNNYFFVVSHGKKSDTIKNLAYRFEDDLFFKRTSIPKGNSTIKVSAFDQVGWVSQEFALATFFQTAWVPLSDFNRYHSLFRDPCFFISFFFYCTVFYYINYYRYINNDYSFSN